MRWLPLLLLSSGRGKASAEECKDENAECRAWAQMGECDANAGYMHASCRESCGLCSGKSSGRRGGAGSGGGGGGGGGGGSGGGGGGGGGGGPVTSDELLGDGAYELHLGRFGGGAKTLHTARLDLRAARAWCDSRPLCKGFTAHLTEPHATSQVLALTLARARARVRVRARARALTLALARAPARPPPLVRPGLNPPRRAPG